MIVNFHPKEIESVKGLEIIARLNANNEHKVLHVLDKTTEEWQAIISSDEKLQFVAPIYWGAAGYEFEKWVQNVFTPGFAFQYSAEGFPQGLLKERAFELHLTHGTPTAYAGKMIENIKSRFLDGIFTFCNAKLDLHFYDQQA